MRILAVEDDQALLGAIVSLLKDEMYEVDWAETGEEGLVLAEQGIYDMLLLDVMLPGINGFQIIKRLRSQQILTPILLLTAKDSVTDRVNGLDAGADDYLTKPFAAQELLARIRALLRRQGKMTPEGDLTYGPLSIRPDAHDGYVDKQPLKMTIKEYELLEFLLRNREQILTREQIFDRVWGFDSDASAAVVDVYIHYLRKKLAPFGYDKLIRTVRGIGFMLKEQSNE